MYGMLPLKETNGSFILVNQTLLSHNKTYRTI